MAKSQAPMISLVLITTSLLLALPTLGFNGEVRRDCPEDCHCHYSRINWVTDCSESNLTAIPFEGLDPDVYVLDMNGNNIEQIEPFPLNSTFKDDEIKLRRLQMAHNKITELRHESFAGLKYLLDADFSYNEIHYVDPDAFR